MADDNLILSETAKAWAEIVLKIWEDKLTKLKVNTSYSLINSLLFHVITAANGDPVMINFFFNYYGRFVDMGVGKGLPASGRGAVEFKRRAKPWFSRAFYSQVIKLSEVYSKKYAQKASFVIVQTIESKVA